ncbi:MAG: restriction endonuclease [Patescibacteria group bacterium]
MATYQTYLTNDYTGETILIKSNDKFIFDEKVRKRQRIWEEQHIKYENLRAKEKSQNEALNSTKLAQEEINSYKTILKYTLDRNDKIDWESIKNNKIFKSYAPSEKPIKEEFLIGVPKKSFIEFVPIFKEKRINAEIKAEESFAVAEEEWGKIEERRKEVYEKEKADFELQQKAFNEEIDAKRASYEKGERDGVVHYIETVLDRSEYPETLNLSSEVSYESNSKLLLIEMSLPYTEEVPYIKEFKYIRSRDSIEEVKMGIKEFEQFYNEVIYQILLRTIHEVFESDYNNHVETIVINGWVEGIDSKTGNKFNNCIASLQVNREEFGDINLINVAPTDCFKHLKGITAGSLSKLAPVKPIMQLNTEDNRIIQASSVIEGLDETVNLAIMDWQEFEVLVRDLVQKMFSTDTCRVEVTRASRDAGVDAIAFDQDPIRGGKYVIQAKRYNNLVPVSAVRDLYGTMLNEGAVKGILVTTSYYGKDSLEFAKDKPLKLINGEELIYLFNKYGYKVRIELNKKQRAASSVTY